MKERKTETSPAILSPGLHEPLVHFIAADIADFYDDYERGEALRDCITGAIDRFKREAEGPHKETP